MLVFETNQNKRTINGEFIWAYLNSVAYQTKLKHNFLSSIQIQISLDSHKSYRLHFRS